MHRLPPLAAALLAALVLPLAAWGLTIDDFESSDFFLSDTNPSGGSTSATAQGSVSGVLGGTREPIVNLTAGSGSPELSLAVSGGALTFAANADATDGHFTMHYDGGADFSYDESGGALNVDLTADGADRFVVDVSSASGSIAIAVRVADSTTNFVSSGQFISSAGLFEFPFSSFAGIDFTDIQSIRLQKTGGVTDPNESFTFDSFFTAVPEPSTALLLGIGILALAGARRRGTA